MRVSENSQIRRICISGALFLFYAPRFFQCGIIVIDLSVFYEFMCKNPAPKCGIFDCISFVNETWWRLLDSNQWPHACEYSIGRVGVTFPFHPGLSCPDFVISASYPLHCLRPDFSIVGQVVGQNSDHLLKRVCGGRTVVVQLTRVKVNTGAGISCPF